MKAAIVGLVRGYPTIYSYSKLIKRNKLLHKNFNRRYNYPVIIFHEGNILPEHQKLMAYLTPNVTFISLESKAFIAPTSLPIEYETEIGYKHMCRFYAIQIYDILSEFDYFLRLDDDSYLESPIKYDIFAFLRQERLIYGYIHGENDYHPQTIKTLPHFTREYIEKYHIKPLCSMDEINEFYYYSNFTLTETSFWRRPDVQGYLHAVDESLGIYKYRWGDHVLQTLALKIFCEPQKIYHFKDFKYSHGSHGWANYPRKKQVLPLVSLRRRITRRFECMYLDTMLKIVNN